MAEQAVGLGLVGLGPRGGRDGLIVGLPVTQARGVERTVRGRLGLAAGPAVGGLGGVGRDAAGDADAGRAGVGGGVRQGPAAARLDGLMLQPAAVPCLDARGLLAAPGDVAEGVPGLVGAGAADRVRLAPALKVVDFRGGRRMRASVSRERDREGRERGGEEARGRGGEGARGPRTED